MLFFSYLVLALASIMAALLVYRQSAPLTEKSKVAASIVAICSLLITLSAITPLVVNGRSDDSEMLRLMFSNLQLYLALPLICTIILFRGIGKDYSKAAWGRWSLVLLALFELCRRAEVGDYYSVSIAVLGSFCIAAGLIYKQTKLTALPVIASISFAGSALMFSPHIQINSSLDHLRELSTYNIVLALSLCLVSFCFSKRLDTHSK